MVTERVFPIHIAKNIGHRGRSPSAIPRTITWCRVPVEDSGQRPEPKIPGEGRKASRRGWRGMARIGCPHLFCLATSRIPTHSPHARRTKRFTGPARRHWTRNEHLCAPAPVPPRVRRRRFDQRVCRPPAKRQAPIRRRPPIEARRAYFFLLSLAGFLAVPFFGFLTSFFWALFPFAMISPRFHFRCASGCPASRPTPNRHRVSLNGAVLCSAWYHTRGAAATPITTRSVACRIPLA